MPLAFPITGQSNAVHNFANIEAALKLAYGPDTLALKVAVGGSSVTLWQRGKSVYQSALGATLQAIADGYTIAALLDFQGERDARAVALANNWLTLKLKFFDDFSADIGAPGLPVVYAQIGNTPNPATPWPGWGTVFSAALTIKQQRPQYKMVTTYNAGAYVVEADGSIGPHFGATALHTIATRFVNNTLALVPAP